MFGRVRSLMAKAERELQHAHSTMDSAQLTLDLAKALIADIQDGVAVSIRVDDDAAKSVAKLLIGHGGEFPLSLAVDLEYDTNPNEVSKCVGGPYDGKAFRIPDAAIESGEMVLKGGHKYKWDGKVFQYEG